jgi:hypothetical protein
MIKMLTVVLAASALPLPRTGLCPTGYHPSSGYCTPSTRDAAPAIPRRGACPSGFAPSGDFCVGKPTK